MSFLSLDADLITQAYPDQPLAVGDESTVGEVLELMRAERGSCVLVCAEEADECRLVGIFTERDALRWMAEGGPAEISIVLAMTPEPLTLPVTANVGAVIETMSRRGYRHLPVVDQSGAPLGVVATNGIIRYLVEHFPQTIYTLPPEPGKTYQQREGA